MTSGNADQGAAEHRVAVLGASPKPDRYSNMAVRLLKDHGYDVIPVHPAHETIEGLPVVADLAAIKGACDTLSLYLGPANTGPMIDQIVKLAPGRVIFNPGTESQPLQDALEAAEIPYLQACTLVMLRTGQFRTALAGRP